MVLIGRRQIGKTYSVREFGRENYEDVTHINLEEMPEQESILSENSTTESSRTESGPSTSKGLGTTGRWHMGSRRIQIPMHVVHSGSSGERSN